MFQKVQRVKTILRLIREQVPQYGPLITQDLHAFREELLKATAGAVVGGVALLIFVCFLSAAVIITAWDSSARIACAWLICGFWLVLAIAGLRYAQKATAGPPPFRLLSQALARDHQGLLALIDM